MPGADDPAILADIVRSLGRDLPQVREAVAAIGSKSGGAFAGDGPGREGSADQRLLRQRRSRGRDPRAGDPGRLLPRRPRPARPGHWRLALPSRRATSWSRATGRCSTPCGTGRRSGGTTAPPPRESAEMAGNERVDVLIIGSGASGAAVAWSLADTKMRILCLEQGDWMKSDRLPQQRPRLGGPAPHRFRHQPEPPRARHRLSGQRRQLAR